MGNITHPQLGNLVKYGTALHTEKDVEYTIYYTDERFFVAVPTDTDITSTKVNMFAVAHVDYEKNHNKLAKHYKGGTYLINGSVYDPIEGKVLVDYASIVDDVVKGDYLRPHRMFYEEITVPRFEIIGDSNFK